MTEAEGMRSTTKQVTKEVMNGLNLDLPPQLYTEDFISPPGGSGTEPSP